LSTSAWPCGTRRRSAHHALPRPSRIERGDYYVDTGNLAGDHAWHLGLEGLWNEGPVSVLAEVQRAKSQRPRKRESRFHRVLRHRKLDHQRRDQALRPHAGLRAPGNAGQPLGRARSWLSGSRTRTWTTVSCTAASSTRRISASTGGRLVDGNSAWAGSYVARPLRQEGRDRQHPDAHSVGILTWPARVTCQDGRLALETSQRS